MGHFTAGMAPFFAHTSRLNSQQRVEMTLLKASGFPVSTPVKLDLGHVFLAFFACMSVGRRIKYQPVYVNLVGKVIPRA